MKNTLLILFYIFVITFQIKSQDLTRSYALYLPAIASENKEYQEQINASLHYYARLNPELIYYYIKYLDARFNQKISNADSNYHNYLLSLEKELVIERNKWIQTQKTEAWDYVNSWIEYRRIASLYDEFDVERQESKKVTIIPDTDKKLQDYFIYLYFFQKSDSGFKSSTDYKKIVETEIQKNVNHLSLAYENADALNTEEKNQYLQKVLAYPFLLKNYYKSFFENSGEYELYQLVDKFFLNDYLIKNEIFISGSYQLGRLHDESQFNLKNERFPFYASPLKYGATLVAKNGFNIGIGFKLALNEKKTFLSYIKLGFVYGIGISVEDTSSLAKIQYLNTRLIGRKEFNGNIYRDDTQFSNKRFFVVYASFPTIYIFKNFYAEIGINYSHFKIDYSTSIRRDVNPTVFYSDEPGDYDTSPILRTFNHSNSEIWPYLSFNYTIFDRYTINISTIGPDLIGVGVDVALFKF